MSILSAVGSIGFMVALFLAIVVPVGLMMIDSKLNGIRAEVRRLREIAELFIGERGVPSDARDDVAPGEGI